MEFRRLKRLCIKALLNGARKEPGTGVHWDISRGCSSPKYVAHGARPDAAGRERTIRVAPGKPIPLNLTIEVPCGKCTKCRLRKRRMWASRAIIESKRTALRGCRMWFGTLTCSPDYLYRMRCGAAFRYEKRSGTVGEFDRRNAEEQFRLLDGEIYRDIIKFLKRLRTGQEKAAPAQFIYLCVTEAHESGAPHYHILIHETDASSPIRKEALRVAEWPGGFVKFKLAEPLDLRSAGYICKYIAKGPSRVRASKKYGRQDDMHRAGTPQPAVVGERSEPQEPPHVPGLPGGY